MEAESLPWSAFGQVLIPKDQVRGLRLGGTGKEPLTSESGDWKLLLLSLPTKKDMILEECLI